MKKKLLFLTVLVLAMSIVLVGCADNSLGSGVSGKSQQEFYDLVKANQELLDDLADDLYRNWYDAIYKDKFYGDINTAILMAQIDNEENINTINANDTTIKDLFKNKNLKKSDICKEVISAYSDYYEFVINVSGSFQSFSADKETKKKALASALKNLEFDL